MGILYSTIGLMIESVITCLCNNMRGYVDVMKCRYVCSKCINIVVND